MILEDDVKIDDVRSFLSSDYKYESGYDIFQLNKRWHHAQNYYLNFDGLESYVITERAARVLIDTTHNSEHFNDKVKSGPYGRYHTSKLAQSKLFTEDKQDWSVLNTISTAVDKFVGFCCHPTLVNSKKLSVKFSPLIGICKNEQKSDIELSGIKPWHECTEYELVNFKKTPYYEFWKKRMYLSPSHIPQNKIKFSFLTTSMNRCSDLKKTYFKNISVAGKILNQNYEFILLNYSSTDQINDWVKRSNFGKYCNFKYVTSKKWKYFNMSCAKNMVGRVASGSVLCWLDSDNLLTPEYLNKLESLFVNKNVFLTANFNDIDSDGKCGRIACYADDFYEINGYDESFVGWGYEDIDFTNRLKITNVTQYTIENKYIKCIDNDDINKFINYKDSSPLEISKKSSFAGFRYSTNLQNFAKSQKNIIEKKYHANNQKSWGEI